MLYDRKSFGVVISRLRVQKGMTQEGLSGLAGIARSHLAALEKGEKTVKLDTVWRIAYALGLRSSELIRLTESEHRGKHDQYGFSSNADILFYSIKVLERGEI